MLKYISYSFFLIFLFISCNKTVKVRSGEDAFDVGQYSIAVQMLETEYEKAGSATVRSDKAFLLGRSYEKMNEPDKALLWYRRSATNSDSPSRLVYLAYALKNTGHYQEALTTFEELAKRLNDNNRFRNEIVSLHNAYQWAQDATNNPFKISLSPFNTEFADYSPAISPEGKVVFTSDRISGSDSELYKWTGRGYSNLFIADSNSEVAVPLEGPFNTSDNEGSLMYAPNGNELVFCRCFDRVGGDKNCKLMYSRKIGETWSDPQVMTFVVDSLNYLSPSFGVDSNILFFAMADPRYNTGFDIYYTQRKADSWQEPIRLPGVINTEYNEKYISFDRDTLYFSSDNPAGMGGLDIYRTYVSRGSWMPAVNMKAPLNSAYDDFGMVFDQKFKPEGNFLSRGFFTSNRSGGKGLDDVYQFTKIESQPATPAIDTTSEDGNSLVVRLSVYVKGYKVSGGQISTVAEELSGAKVSIHHDSRDTILVADKYGKATILVKLKDDPEITASKEGFLTSSRKIKRSVIRIDSTKAVQDFSIVMNLYPILYDQEIVIKDIYYDLDKYEIRKDAVGSLDELLSILKLNPGFKIKINSHTDCRGSNAYNMTLSAKRAKSVVDYLTSHGIKANRLSSQGYGETRPIAKCVCEKCTEEQHQLNRRTTFQLVK